MSLPNRKIAFVSNTSWSIYNFRLEAALFFLNNGFEIFTIAPRDKHSEKLIAAGFTFIEAPIKAYSNNPLDDIKYYLFLRATYKRHRFSHVFHYTIKANIYGSIAARIMGANSTAVITGLGRLLSMNDGIKKTTILKLYKFGLASAEHIWFLNQLDKSYFEQKNIVGLNESYLLPSEGIDLSKFTLKKKKDFSSISFLFAGRLIKEKGIELFLQAAFHIKKYYPNVEFNVVGFIDPKDLDSIDQNVLLQTQMKGLVTFYGDTEDIRPFIESASCVVLPSIYGEGVSRILLEAASMSTPIITSNNRGCKDVVIDGYNGFLCRKNDLDHLVEQILAFISLDQEAKEAMGKNGRNIISAKFNMDKVIAHYANRLGIKSHDFNSVHH